MNVRKMQYRSPAMRLASCVVIAVVAAASCAAITGTKSVFQKGRAFSEELVVVNKGDTITFVNDDTVPHNIYSASRGNAFDLGSQTPGMATDVTFTEAGEVDVLCAIHPRMKMVVRIAE
jgi:plastocyanin